MELVSGFTPDQISQYTRIQSDREKFVGMNDYKWSADDELFTMGAATCLVPVVVNEGEDTLGLGHFFPSSTVKFRILRSPRSAELDMYLEEASLLVTAGNTKMYLFGGTAAGENGDFLRGARDETLRRFSGIGLECVDLTPPQSGLILRILVANIQDKTIRYHYEPYDR